MSHRFPFPSGRTFLAQVALVVLLGSFSHCQKKDETPPPPKAAETPVAAPVPSPPAPAPLAASPTTAPAEDQGLNDCCVIAANPDIKGRLGRLVVTYPEGTKAGNTRVDVYKPGEHTSLAGGYGGRTFDLMPGAYEVAISKKRIGGVTIKSAHDTRVKVGLLRVNAGKETRVDLVDMGSPDTLTGGYGNQEFGLPIGQVQVKVAGQAETVTIEDGKVTEF